MSFLFEDSPDELRTRDSLGNDVVTGPGGIVWTQAGSGPVHQEMAVKPEGDLHLLQLFVNLTRHDKLTPPRMFQVDGDKVPEWHSDAGGQPDFARCTCAFLDDISHRSCFECRTAW